ncbi:MAG TPA: penicillin-binding transpeptidase domain-containing protein [Myxococcota bacterium]|nr:penicillin-binding transpeptidase domain-containing protein [Myxococcota bacterium]
MRAPELRTSTRRLGAARSLLVLAFVALALRASHLALVDTRGARRGDAQILTELTLPPERGMIVDRHGAELAVTVQAPTVYAVPSQVKDPAAAAKALARILRADPRRVQDRLERRGSFAYVARWVTEAQATEVRGLGLPGIAILHEPRRVYPNRELAAHVVGFANIDGQGIRGLEQQEDAWLRGRERTFPVERDARGRVLAGFAPGPDATSGGDVALTIDAGMQADAEVALDAWVAKTRSKGGFVITLDPHTGEILALAERPGFDPNHFREVPFPNTRARSVLDAFEPGSTFKTFLVAAALDAGAVHTSDTFDCEHGRWKVPGKLIRDSHPHGVLDVPSVLRVSSNIGAAKIGFRLGAPRFYDMLVRFGFGQLSGSGFPNESPGLLRPWQRWRPVDQANAAFGQGVSVTPMQIAVALAGIANDGVVVRPRLVAARREPGGVWTPTAIEGARRVLRSETAATMRDLLESVVAMEEGTGNKAALPGIRVGGKTGTAQKLDPATRRYAQHAFLAWFTGVAPIDDPKLVIVTMLDEPQGFFHTGGLVAAPLFADVAAPQLARLGILGALPETQVAAAPPKLSKSAAELAATSGDDAVAAAEQAPVTLVRDGDRFLVPDLAGRTVAEVRDALSGGGIEAELVGEGRAVAQEPDPGTILQGNARRVRVRFEPGA